jgi:hypothetical protein
MKLTEFEGDLHPDAAGYYAAGYQAKKLAEIKHYFEIDQARYKLTPTWEEIFRPEERMEWLGQECYHHISAWGKTHLLLSAQETRKHLIIHGYKHAEQDYRFIVM